MNEREKSVQEIAHELAMLHELKSFVDGAFQTHHHRTTVLDHSIHVAEFSSSIATVLENIGICISRKELIRGALLHDIGIVGNRNKGKKILGHCLIVFHPIESLRIAKASVPDLTTKERNIILCHMFPISLCFPHSIEAWIVTIADKVVAVQEGFGYLSPLRTVVFRQMRLEGLI